MPPAPRTRGVVKPKGHARIRAHEGLHTISVRDRKPEWLKVRAPGGSEYLRLKRLMRTQSLHTVCEEAGCPNIGECWEAGNRDLHDLGRRVHTRLQVLRGGPRDAHPARPGRTPARGRDGSGDVARARGDHQREPGRAARRRSLRLRRNHPADQGARSGLLGGGCSFPTSRATSMRCTSCRTPAPSILGHNLETVERLHPEVRPGGRYWALDLVARRGLQAGSDPSTSSPRAGHHPGHGGGGTGDSTGHGANLREAAVDILTLGPVSASLACSIFPVAPLGHTGRVQRAGSGWAKRSWGSGTWRRARSCARATMPRSRRARWRQANGRAHPERCWRSDLSRRRPSGCPAPGSCSSSIGRALRRASGRLNVSRRSCCQESSDGR